MCPLGVELLRIQPLGKKRKERQMAITRKDQQELAQVFTDLGPDFKGRKEDYFPVLYMAKKFKCEPRSIAQQVAFGGNDYGIDAYFIERPSKNLYLFQFKWSEDHNLFKDSMERLATDGIERIVIQG